jgi:hypothetical protein
LVLAAIYAFEILPNSPSGSTKLASVTVSGSAVLVQQGSIPLNLLFSDEGGKVFNATITNGHYNIVLPTNHSYTVSFRWAASPEVIAGAVGQCSEENFTVPASPASATISKDWSC